MCPGRRGAHRRRLTPVDPATSMRSVPPETGLRADRVSVSGPNASSELLGEEEPIDGVREAGQERRLELVGVGE